MGLGLAIELGQRDVSVAVIEQNSSPPRIPKGQNLTQRTMEHMQAWGVEKAIRAAKTIPEHVGIGGLTAYGTLLSGYHYDWFRREAVDQFYNAANERLPQYLTEEVLRARAAALPSLEIFYGWKTISVEQDSEKVSATARIEGGELRTLSGQFLVGCDGSHSFVRRAVDITETREEHDRLMALIVFSSPEFFRLVERFHNKQFFNVLHPDNDGYWMFFGMVEWGKSFFFHAPVPAGFDRQTFDFKDFLHKAVGREFELELDYVGYWDLRIATSDKYRDNRVFIAGDAAHSHPPYGGYGINTGFEDARNLGWKLGAVLQGWGNNALLSSYEAERRPVFLSTARDFISKFIEEDRAFVRTHDPDVDREKFDRAWTARAEGGSVKGIATFAPHYEGSPCVVGAKNNVSSAQGSHSLEARPGHHLPPLQLTDGTVTTDRLGEKFTVFAGRKAVPLQDLSTDVDFVTAPLTQTEQEYLVVRPDGFVAGIGNSAEGVTAILHSARG